MSVCEGDTTGTVKWFDKDKGYGFIRLPGGGLDVFVHANQLRLSGIDRSLIDNERVKFRISKGEKGSFATDIVLLDQ